MNRMCIQGLFWIGVLSNLIRENIMEKTDLFQNCIESELPQGLKLRLDKGEVTDITFSPDGTRLAAGGDGRIWIYDTASGAQFAMLSGYTERVARGGRSRLIIRYSRVAVKTIHFACGIPRLPVKP